MCRLAWPGAVLQQSTGRQLALLHLQPLGPVQPGQLRLQDLHPPGPALRGGAGLLTAGGAGGRVGGAQEDKLSQAQLRHAGRGCGGRGGGG